MNPDSATARYREDAIANAPPIKIVRMLYQGALRFLDRALECDSDDLTSDFLPMVQRADAIVAELRCSLREDAAPEVTENLKQLYLFVETELARAIGDRDPEHLVHARQVLATLSQAWAEANPEAA
jgi:flagellar protein FliS